MQFLVEVDDIDSVIFEESGSFTASSEFFKSQIESLLQVFESDEMSTVGEQLANFVSDVYGGVVSKISDPKELEALENNATEMVESLSGRQKAMLDRWKDYP
jgi:hypothetical protein